MKIGIIAHYSSMREDFSYLEKELNCKLIFKIGVLDLAITVAEKLVSVHGVDAIITSSKTVDVIKDYVDVPLISLYVTNFNLAEALVDAKKICNEIVFAELSKENIKHNFEKVEEIIGYKVDRYLFDELEQTAAIVERALDEGKELLVTTASCLISKAKEKGLKTYLIQTKREDFIDAVEHAKNIVEIRNTEANKNQWLKVIVENTDQGLIALDRAGRIIVFNKEAQRLTSIFDGEKIIGMMMSEICRDFDVLKKIYEVKTDLDVIIKASREILVHKHNILRKNDKIGSVIVVRSVESVEKMEMTTRKKMIPEGFFASSNFEDIKGYSQSIIEVKQKAIKYSRTNSNILIIGESGSGKELFAQSIHNYSECSSGPFLAVNCATFSQNLLESELFGYDKGAFTGANKEGKKGLFELAHNGTLFLDEIGEMPLEIQARLLRVIQERFVRRIGGEKNIPVNVRIICATNRNLRVAVKNNQFRKDLFYRINVLSVKVPALRQRKEDIKVIAKDLLNRVCKSQNKEIFMTENQLDKLKDNDWDGNVRELANFIERLVAVTEVYKVEDQIFDELLSEVIEIEDCKQEIQNFSEQDDYNISTNQDSLIETDYIRVPLSNIKEMEKYIIKSMIDKHLGNKKKVSEELGVSLTTLWRKIKESETKVN